MHFTGPEMAVITAVALASALAGTWVGIAVERRRTLLAVAPIDPELEPTETWHPRNRKQDVARWLELAMLLLAGSIAVAGALLGGAALVLRAVV